MEFSVSERYFISDYCINCVQGNEAEIQVKQQLYFCSSEVTQAPAKAAEGAILKWIFRVKDPGLYQNKRDQQVEGGDALPPEVLPSALGTTA